MYSIRKADPGDARIIHELIHQIYYPTYHEILSRQQIDFMLTKSYTENALKEAMSAGQDFFILWEDDLPLGFVAVQNKNDFILRIEKLYILPGQQGKGLGVKLIDFAAAEAIERQRPMLELNVNRANKAYFFYLRQGFRVVKEVDIPYYGYILDDYIMQKVL